MKVREIMTKPAKSCGPQNNLAEAVKIMWDCDCGTVPIIARDRKLLGMITDRDVAMAVGTQNKRPSEIRVDEAMSEAAYACTPDDDIQAALKTMRHERVRRLPVVNSKFELEGLLSINDIALRAEKLDGLRTPELSYDDVVTTLKAICEHRTETAIAEARSASN
jgi:CBS domain-containing protein